MYYTLDYNFYFVLLIECMQFVQVTTLFTYIQIVNTV